MTAPYDIILITGEEYADHPANAAGLLKRFLEHHGFSIGIISKPDWKSDADFTQLGTPRLFFGISSGPIDSLLQNYTSLKRSRKDDPNVPYASGVPDRAVTVYANMIRKLFPGIPMVLGGVEASLRRLAHYDFWSNKIRTGILFDTRADILVYGPGEYPLLEIARRLQENAEADLTGIPSTCIISSEMPDNFSLLPSTEDVREDPDAFCRLQRELSAVKNLAQGFQNRFVLQYRQEPISQKELDAVYDLPFTRELPKGHPLEMAQFSIITHRGCFGNCSFCSLALLQGARIVSRSIPSIINEIKRITDHPQFKGYIDDLGGPSANMYGMDCRCSDDKPEGACISCGNLDRSQSPMLDLLAQARAVPGIKKVFIRSGIRFDLVSRKYLETISKHHISGTLKIAPEHFSRQVLKCMNKDFGDFDDFVKDFNDINQESGQQLRYYLMVAHPGSTEKDFKQLEKKVRKLQNTESIQIFIPLPMTASACMFYTGKDPYSMKTLYIPKTFKEKKDRRNRLQKATKMGYGKKR